VQEQKESFKRKSKTGAAIRWQCRRGMLELDLILLDYFDNCYERLEPKQQLMFTQLLEQTDHTLYQWLVTQTTPDSSIDPELVLLIQTIRQHK
jgi:antitoxin CptB